MIRWVFFPYTSQYTPVLSEDKTQPCAKGWWSSEPTVTSSPPQSTRTGWSRAKYHTKEQNDRKWLENPEVLEKSCNHQWDGRQLCLVTALANVCSFRQCWLDCYRALVHTGWFWRCHPLNFSSWVCRPPVWQHLVTIVSVQNSQTLQQGILLYQLLW